MKLISKSQITYPDCDGNPMSDNTRQFRLIVMIKENLEIFYATFIDIFVTGDLLWYPIEGDNKTRLAPDVMVAFGRPKGDRGSYQQWNEDNIAPQVAFEILSPSNYAPEMESKRVFYETHGVEEYYSYDPDRLRLKGWMRQGSQLLPIPEMNGWVSPRMNIRFTHPEGSLELYRPDGRKFLTSVELDDLANQAIDRANQAIVQADQAIVRANQAELQVRSMIVNLLRSGMAVDQIAAITGMNCEQIQDIQTTL